MTRLSQDKKARISCSSAIDSVVDVNGLPRFLKELYMGPICLDICFAEVNQIGSLGAASGNARGTYNATNH